ncbi:FAD:protein FMN transferase [Gynuella sunshinyii]|uniref:FAD:protein FMN transferase n=1 Tax=Gynuella sunshinyii YC6258 TaxID=1445510 RepID=A0A0C5V2L2_9GAMM|nr:FAD:protein FMN transferase [Gynuella sunshinyii]AJQ93720.1 membrane-associated lipoprotein involved in thiamine biosynthesis [Gynuella sunshinyii YC6258]
MSFQFQLSQFDDYTKAAFPAMASPCEILFDSTDLEQVMALGLEARAETWRIEQKFSRYRQDNIIHKINNACGKTIHVDDETADLLDFANQVYELSEARFDVTSGILRKVWKFDGSDQLADDKAIAALLPLIGWHQVNWSRPYLTLPEGMEIDLGGIGKEYAVDKVFSQLTQHCENALLVNFGGDLRARGPRKDGSAWKVGVEQIVPEQQIRHLEMTAGAMATSGDSRRYLLKDGIRYSHILNPKTGWPVMNAPRSITVVAPTCVEAGIYSSLSLMMGDEAEKFLEELDIRYWSVR